jgi:hypothetical protein
MIELPLTKGYVAVIDDSDARLAKNKWTALEVKRKDGSIRRVYAVRGEYRSSVDNHRLLYLHRAVLGLKDPKDNADHIDGNGLNNLRSNLRICTHRENTRHEKGLRANNTSGYRGVSLRHDGKKWVASIRLGDGKRKILGSFVDPKMAAAAYDEAAKKHHGTFATINEVSQ